MPVCSPALRNDPKRPLKRPEDLARHVLLHAETSGGGSMPLEWPIWLRAMKVEGLKPAGVLHFSLYDQMIHAAIDGQGVGPRPRAARLAADPRGPARRAVPEAHRLGARLSPAALGRVGGQARGDAVRRLADRAVARGDAAGEGWMKGVWRRTGRIATCRRRLLRRPAAQPVARFDAGEHRHRARRALRLGRPGRTRPAALLRQRTEHGRPRSSCARHPGPATRSKASTSSCCATFAAPSADGQSGLRKSFSIHAVALAASSLKPAATRTRANGSPASSIAPSRACGSSSSGTMSSVTVIRPVARRHRDALVKQRMQLLLVPAQHLRGGLDQRVERGGVERLGVLLVAPHRPGADQRRLGLAVACHLHRPAVVVLVLDDAGGPPVVAPQPRLVQCIGQVGFGGACVEFNVMVEILLATGASGWRLAGRREVSIPKQPFPANTSSASRGDTG